MESNPTHQASPPDEDAIDLGRLLATLWRGKIIIALIALICLLAGGYYAYVMAVPQYRSTSVVILETQQQSVVDIESVIGGISGDTSAINSEIEVLKSRTLMRKVVERLDLVNDPEFNTALREPDMLSQVKAFVRTALQGPEEAVAYAPEAQAARDLNRTVDTLLQYTSVRNVPNSYVFQIEVTSEAPQKAAEIADMIAELYILNQLEVKFEATQQATAWLTDQVGELRVALEDAEAQLAEFSANTELVSVEALQALERQIKDSRDRIAGTVEAAAAQQQRLAALEAASTREQRAAAAEDPQLTRFLPRVAQDESVAEAFDTRFGQILDRARLDVSRTEQQLQALRASESDLRSRIEVQGEDLIQLQQLQREAEASRALYEYFLGRLKETSAQQGIQQADSRVLSNAVIPLQPSEPRRSLILAMSLLFGLMLGSGLVLFREARNNSFRTSEDLEAATGMNVIGQIPRMPVKGRHRVLTYLSEKPTSNVSEAYRNLRTSVVLSDIDSPPKVILSTSAIPGEGKTTNSIALAQSFAGLGKKVLLIEGDIRRRTLHQYFSGTPREGLVSVLSGSASQEDAVFRPEGFGADVLLGEKTDVNAADLFSSNRFREFISDMREKYDAVIIDTPPVLIVPDARIIAAQADKVLFTVQWDSTSRAQITESLRLFRQSGQKITGLVLSQISPRGMRRYGYGGKYGAYGAYGSKYYSN
ncbi:chain-length determining protein [Vannielia litorea]|nr:chain-length determining protein [Vannielia litorea]